MQTRKILRGLQAGLEAVQAYRQHTAPSIPATNTSADSSVLDTSELDNLSPTKSAPPSVQVLPPTTIRTSEKDWLPRLTRAYREHADVELIDDASLGVDPATQSLLQMGLAGKLTRKEWTAVSLSAGMTIFGATMIVLAVLDPEPTSKLGLLVASGALLALTGGFQTIHLLTRQKPPSITISARGVHIDWH